MAVIVTLTNIKQGVESDGNRSVEATHDFDTGGYTTDGIALGTVDAVLAGVTYPSVLEALGIKSVRKVYIAASADVDQPYTEAEFVAANDTVTYNYFVNLSNAVATPPSTPEAPRLRVFSAGDELADAAAIAATAQVRIKYVFE